MIQVCSSGWNSSWRLEYECSSLICTDLSIWAATKCQSVCLLSCVIPGTPSRHRLLFFVRLGFFGLFFFKEILIRLNKIRYPLVQQ